MRVRGSGFSIQGSVRGSRFEVQGSGFRVRSRERRTANPEPNAERTLVLVNSPCLAAPVIAAVRAHAVRELRLVAMRAFAEPGRLQRVVGPTFGRPGLRMSSFWVGLVTRHGGHDVQISDPFVRPLCPPWWRVVTTVSSTLSAPPASGLPIHACSHKSCDCGPCRRPDTTPGSRPGRAVSSAAKDKTAPASAAAGRSSAARKRPWTDRLPRSRALPRRRCPRAVDTAGRTPRRWAR